MRGEQLPGELGAALSDPAAAFLAAWDQQSGDGDLDPLSGAAWDVLDGLADYRHSPITPTGLLTAADRLTPLLPARNETLAEPVPAPAAFPDGDPVHWRRWYTKAELDGYQLVKAADHDTTGTYDVIVAGERVGQIRPGRTATGARSGWQALYRMTPVAHTGKGRTARTQEAAVVDLLSDLHLRWNNARDRDRRS